MNQQLLALKTEFEEQKEAEFENLRRSFTTEQEKKEQSYTCKMSQLTAQLQQLDAVVAQVLDTHSCIDSLSINFFSLYLHFIEARLDRPRN